jgi:hypothetical protein
MNMDTNSAGTDTDTNSDIDTDMDLNMNMSMGTNTDMVIRNMEMDTDMDVNTDMAQTWTWPKTRTSGMDMDIRRWLTVPDGRRRIIPEVVLVGRWSVGVLGIWKGEGLGKGRDKGGQFTSNLRPRWTDPVTARRVPSK